MAAWTPVCRLRGGRRRTASSGSSITLAFSDVVATISARRPAAASAAGSQCVALTALTSSVPVFGPSRLPRVEA